MIKIQPASSSCFFDVTLMIPDSPDGQFINTTSNIFGSFGQVNPAQDVLTIILAIDLEKTFLNDPIDLSVGTTVTLQFQLTNQANLPATATTFTDDLDSVLMGLFTTGC